MLTAEKLRKCYGAQVALAALDLTILPGEIYALLGPNGAGKTTTVNLFLGFLEADGGRATVDGIDVAREPTSVRARLAYIPEQVNLYPTLTGRENLAYFAALAGRRLAGAEAAALLAEAGLQADAVDARLGSYSKGMRQKVGVAIALAKQAKAMLLDEPTSGLDPSASHEFSALLRALAGRGVAILMTTHDLFCARDVASRVGIMRGGVLRRELPASSLTAADLEALYLSEMAK